MDATKVRAMNRRTTHDMDDFDRAILTILQEDNTASLRTIGARVHLSAAAVQRRVTRLTSDGVIRRNVAVLDPERVGRPLSIVVEIEAADHGSACIVELCERLRAHAAVQHCYYVTGEIDFIVVLSTATLAEYQGLCGELFHQGRLVKRYRSFIALQRVKETLALRVDSQGHG